MARTSTLAGSVSIGSGYGAVGATITKMDYQCNQRIGCGGNLNFGRKRVDRGWLCQRRFTITDAGVISANSNFAEDGISTLAGSVSTGGAYGNAGVTITDAGVISASNDLAVYETSTLSGSVSIEGAMKLQASRSPMWASLVWMEPQLLQEVYPLAVAMTMQNRNH